MRIEHYLHWQDLSKNEAHKAFFGHLIIENEKKIKIYIK
jgi:hypothetical protein